MPGRNRHRPPSTRLLFNRVYRQQSDSTKVIADLKAQIEQLTASNLIFATVAGHCQRLLREKETLISVILANPYMADALPRRPEVPVLNDVISLEVEHD